MNTCIFIGNLTRDPEVRYMGESKTPLCSFTVAINNKAKGRNGEKTTSFLDCDAWGKVGETIAQYFVKGRQICVNASAVQENWQDKEGNKRSKIKFKVNDFSFVNDGKGGLAKGDGGEDIPASPDDDAPF